MKLVYQGRHGAVVVPTPFGGEQVAQWGEVFETTDEHGAALLQQPGNWRPAPLKAPAAAKEKE